MAFITASFETSWISHDAWSESYVGIRRLVYETLPDSSEKQSAEDSALCQLAIVGCHHLMEVALFGLLHLYIDATSGDFSLTQKQLDDSSYHKALTIWAARATGLALDCNVEPLLSTERLRRRRNDTVHSKSALATVEMCRSALFSATEGTKHLHGLFNQPFKYKLIMDQYPIPTERYFSTVLCP